MKSAYSYIREAFDKGSKEKLIGWRKQEVLTRLEKPTDIGRARKLGYKDKKGFVIVRVKIKRGGRKRARPRSRRKQGKQTIKKVLKMNYQWVAEQKAARKFKNLEVLNSYKIAKDGKYFFFEIIMVDPLRPEITEDKTINWICRPENKGRVFRGLTSAGKKSRGLRTKSREMKTRPSLRAWDRKGK